MLSGQMPWRTMPKILPRLSHNALSPGVVYTGPWPFNRERRMVFELAPNTNTNPVPAPPVPTPPHERSRQPRFSTPRSTMRDSWGWAWKDTIGRVAPMTAAALVYAQLSGEGVGGVGLTRARWRREMALGIAIGAPLAGLAAVFRGWVAPHYRLPTAADQALQTTFYLAINAPAEELFWRGMVQTATTGVAARVPRLRALAPGIGWMVATAGYGSYHRLGGWSWRSIAGVTAAGALFGWLYAGRPGNRSLLAAIIAHGFATAGFLSWGDVALHRAKTRQLRAQFQAQRASTPASQ
jgi:membrane protease YdiL (CAAX protease family)